MNKRIFLRYVAQNIAGMIGLSCYILVDTLFVSVALGASGLAALNLSITVFSVVTGIGQLAGIGGGTDFSLRRAEGRDAERSLPTALLSKRHNTHGLTSLIVSSARQACRGLKVLLAAPFFLLHSQK